MTSTRKCSKTRFFCHFGGLKISKINLLGLNYRVLVSLRWLRVPTGAMAGKVARYATSSRKGIVLKIRTKKDPSKKNFSGRYNCNSENVVYLLQCEVCSKKYVGSTKTKFRQRFNVYKSYFRSYARKHNEGSLDRGKLIPQANFFSHFFDGNHNGKFEVRVK